MRPIAMYINKLKAENWKNFRVIEATIEHRLFLIGPNASGKSNFLDIFRFLRDLCTSGGGLQQAVDVRRGGVSAIRCLAARSKPDILIEVEVTDEKADIIWSYRLKFAQDNNRRPIIREEVVKLNNKVLINRPDFDDELDDIRLTETALEQTVANKDFRKMVEFFQSISYQHLVPQAMRDPQGFSPGKVDNDSFGRDFLQRVDQAPPRTKDSRLRKILTAMKVAVPQLNDLQVKRDDFGVPHLIGMYEHWRPNAARQTEAQFSDGTLRLFGLLWTLFEGDGTILLEEPELSLHPEIVKMLPAIIEKINRQRKIARQVIISTHADAMLDQKSIGGEEVLRLEPSAEGTILKSPLQDPQEMALLKNGLSVRDVVVPKSAPRNIDQLVLSL